MIEFAIWASMVVGVYGLAVLSDWLADIWFRHVARREFDGGWSRENEPVRITRISSRYVVGDWE